MVGKEDEPIAESQAIEEKHEVPVTSNEPTEVEVPVAPAPVVEDITSKELAVDADNPNVQEEAVTLLTFFLAELVIPKL